MGLKECQQLGKWFIANGGTIRSLVEFRWSEDEGQHFRTLQPLLGSEDKPEPVCICPHRLTLSHLNVLSINRPPSILDCSSTSVCTNLIGCVPSSTIQYFFLAEQRLLREQSFWWPYIQALPREEDMLTPLWFDDEDLVWLAGTTLHSSMTDNSKSAVMNRKGMWLDEWTMGRDILRRKGVGVEAYTWDLFVWAATIFSSRSFTSAILLPHFDLDRDFSLLYPMIDSFNHRFGAKAVWNIDSDSFSLATAERTSENEQIYNNYALKSNEELLLGYGFCIPRNPCDQFVLRLGRPPEAVHETLRQRFPLQFPSPDWTQESATFFLRGSGHYSKGYGNDMANLRGIPPELLGAISGIISYAHNDMDEDEIFDATVQALLERVTIMRGAITEWDDKLPAEPQNAKQRFAKMYRDGQLAIADEIISELGDYVLQLTGVLPHA